MSDGPRAAASEARESLRRALPEPLSRSIPGGDGFGAWLASTPEDLVDALVSLSPPFVGEVARLLAAIGEEAADVLSRAEERAVSREGRKAFRRALHRLRSRGIRVNTPRPEGRRPGRLPETPMEEGEGLLGPIGARGERMIVLRTAGAAPGVHQVLASDEKGLLRAETLRGPKGALRRVMGELRRRAPVPLVSASEGSVRELLGRLLRTGDTAGGPGSEALREELDRSSGSGATPGEEIRERLTGPAMPEALAEVELRRRIEKGEVLPWLLVGPSLERAARELQDLRTSRLVLPAAQSRARQEEAMQRVLEEVLDDATRERFATRLEETAFLLEGRGDGDGARAALAVAGRVRSSPRPGRVEFMRLLVELSLERAGQEIRQGEESRLIVSP